MKITIEFDSNNPDEFDTVLAALSASPVGKASAPAPKSPKAKTEPTAAVAPVAPAETTGPQTEPANTSAPVNVTDEMIVAAADAAVVKVGSNPAIIKNAIAARFTKDDGSPATLKTVAAAQRGTLHAFLTMVGQTGDVNGAF